MEYSLTSNEIVVTEDFAFAEEFVSLNFSLVEFAQPINPPL